MFPQALRRWKSEEIYCRLIMSVNAEESLGRENKGDMQMFIAVLFTINDQEKEAAGCPQAGPP